MTLTWKLIDAEMTHQCLSAADVPALREVLHSLADSMVPIPESKQSLKQMYYDKQLEIMIDFFAHLIMFAKAHLMSAEKTSTLVAIAEELHRVSMEQRYSRVASYNHLRALIVRHSVPRPPFCAAIFDVMDVQDLDEYLLSTYYRHYKMYVFVFTKPQVLHLTSVTLESITESPPQNLPALSIAMPETEWRSKMETRERGKEEVLMERQQEESEAMEELRRREAGLRDGAYSDGVREQLESIRDAVQHKSLDRLEQIEAKLATIEAQVLETNSSAKPLSKAGKKK